jgi:hypothetical protein
MELIYIPCKFLVIILQTFHLALFILSLAKDVTKSHALADIGIVMLPAYL